jgi:hypothetical protein
VSNRLHRDVEVGGQEVLDREVRRTGVVQEVAALS